MHALGYDPDAHTEGGWFGSQNIYYDKGIKGQVNGRQRFVVQGRVKKGQYGRQAQGQGRQKGWKQEDKKTRTREKVTHGKNAGTT